MGVLLWCAVVGALAIIAPPINAPRDTTQRAFLDQHYRDHPFRDVADRINLWLASYHWQKANLPDWWGTKERSARAAEVEEVGSSEESSTVPARPVAEYLEPDVVETYGPRFGMFAETLSVSPRQKQVVPWAPPRWHWPAWTLKTLTILYSVLLVLATTVYFYFVWRRSWRLLVVRACLSRTNAQREDWTTSPIRVPWGYVYTPPLDGDCIGRCLYYATAIADNQL